MEALPAPPAAGGSQPAAGHAAPQLGLHLQDGNLESQGMCCPPSSLQRLWSLWGESTRRDRCPPAGFSALLESFSCSIRSITLITCRREQA